MNRELPDVQAGFRKGRGSRYPIANIHWIIEKAREFQKNIYFCFIDYTKAFDCVAYNKLWKILKEMEIPDHLTCLLRNLYAGQEAPLSGLKGVQPPLPFGLPDSSVRGISQARILEWVAIPFSRGSSYPGTPWTVACQAPLSMEFSRQEYWSG